MAEDDSNTDISPYWPSAIAQRSPTILLVEVEQGDVDVQGVIGALLSADQSATSRLAELPGASTIRRWVLEMLQPQAVSAILQSKPFLWRSYSISILSETDMSLHERVKSRERASLVGWGIGSPVPDTISPSVLSTSLDITAAAGQAMELDEEEQMSDYLPALANAEPETTSSSSPAAAEIPSFLNDETLTMIENTLYSIGMQMVGSMLPSRTHADVIAQRREKDEHEMDDKELEEDTNNMEHMLEAAAYASSSGSVSLAVVEEACRGISHLIVPEGKR
ncbi:hypothetical protein FRC04_007915 [Tulasnella sp. 424]|nr:hypothetical protein FRC04_007915 [Tulasnella sp. 424]KAG8975098.1 hypothetical protein FRC05_006521 [Tulasnella sp. 425]